jgi:hypothetical protein
VEGFNARFSKLSPLSDLLRQRGPWRIGGFSQTGGDRQLARRRKCYSQTYNQVMHWLETFVYLTGVYPLAVAWWAQRRGTLLHALSWATGAWLAWGLLIGWTEASPPAAAQYFAICLTACAGIAVLGARRPIVGAWNFVLLGLLAVLLLPLVEHATLDTPLLDPLRLAFIAGTVLVGVLNYLPTRLALPALLIGLQTAGELFARLPASVDMSWDQAQTHLRAWTWPAALWIAWGIMRQRRRDLSAFDRTWLDFRDGYGLMWGQRVREQFNLACKNNGWPVVLRWSGLRRTQHAEPLDTEKQTAIVELLQSILRRFGEAR